MHVGENHNHVDGCENWCNDKPLSVSNLHECFLIGGECIMELDDDCNGNELDGRPFRGGNEMSRQCLCKACLRSRPFSGGSGERCRPFNGDNDDGRLDEGGKHVYSLPFQGRDFGDSPHQKNDSLRQLVIGGINLFEQLSSRMPFDLLFSWGLRLQERCFCHVFVRWSSTDCFRCHRREVEVSYDMFLAPTFFFCRWSRGKFCVYRYAYWPCPTYSCFHVLSMISHAQVWRVGEALNPGPVVVRTFNPAQLLGHESEICKWPDGIWTASETSHTVAALGVLKRRFHQNDVHSVFSQPVEKHSNNAGSYRGKAMGTAILSRLQLVPYPMELEHDVKASCRFSDALVHLGHGVRAYVCVAYAPPINNCTYANGEKVFLNAILPGLQRATNYKGPALITGDFNRDLGDCIFWESLRAKGWHDCAELAWMMHQKVPEPTCKDAARRSFILVNDIMAKFFKDCGTVDHHMFDAHPVLEATFDVGESPCWKQVWSLPEVWMACFLIMRCWRKIVRWLVTEGVINSRRPWLLDMLTKHSSSLH